MRKFIIIFALLTLLFGGVAPAQAAKHHGKKHGHSKCAKPKYKKHHPKKCHVKKKRAAKKRVVKRAAVAPQRVATMAEYKRLDFNMTEAQVASIFDAPKRFIGTGPYTVYVACPQNTKYFCLADDGVTGTGSVVATGAPDNYEWFTGTANKYDYRPGRQCWSITTSFVADALGVKRLVDFSNDSNTCYTNTNK